MKVIILAGGKGTRLWPISREEFPKQFLKLNNDKSLLQQAIDRFPAQDIVIVTCAPFYHLVKNQVKEIRPDLVDQIIVEPEQKNTGPAILYALKYLQEMNKLDPEETVVVSSSDFWIDSNNLFTTAIEKAVEVAREGYLVTFGVRPLKPETGYGYIQIDGNVVADAYPAIAFVEKPDLATAERYVASGDYLWNSGIFAFTAQTFWRELELHNPILFRFTQGTLKDLQNQFHEIPNVSVDYAVMEKSKRIVVIPFNFVWSDVGSWDTIFDMMEKDGKQNATIGNVHTIDTKNSLIIGDKRLISLVGLEDMVVIETEDALFLGKKGESQRVKALVEQLRKNGNKETKEHLTTHRPWGYYKVNTRCGE